MTDNKLKSTHKRLTLIFTAVMFFVVMILGSSFLLTKYTGENSLQKREFLKGSRNIAELSKNIERLTEAFPGFRDFDTFERYEKLRQKKERPWKDISFFIFNRSDNTLLFKKLLEHPYFDIESDTKAGFYKDEGMYIYIFDRGDIRLVTYTSIGYGDEVLFRDFIGLLFLSLLFSFLFYFIGYRFVGRALRPVEENLRDMQDFIHNAGHELKTPLAVMWGNLQIMKAEKNFDTALIKSSLRNIDTMNHLIEGLRELSEVWALREKENLALVVEIKKICKEYESMLQSKNIILKDSTKGALIVHANKNELRMLLANILSNAIKYTPENGEVDISLTKNILSIKDTWQGMSQQEQEKMFTRFYQGSAARSWEGFGIGLSLVKKIADTNGWKLKVKSEVWKGTSFEVVF